MGIAAAVAMMQQPAPVRQTAASLPVSPDGKFGEPGQFRSDYECD
jgi:hypothetical protein